MGDLGPASRPWVTSVGTVPQCPCAVPALLGPGPWESRGALREACGAHPSSDTRALSAGQLQPRHHASGVLGSAGQQSGLTVQTGPPGTAPSALWVTSLLTPVPRLCPGWSSWDVLSGAPPRSRVPAPRSPLEAAATRPHSTAVAKELPAFRVPFPAEWQQIDPPGSLASAVGAAAGSQLSTSGLRVQQTL